ncbi:MAG: endopeptidase La [Erysipelotrichales bacterium]|nr:endopeptidase La [Erysipelotrichales bacterium]
MNNETNTKTLPVLIVKGIIPIPENTITIDVLSTKAINAIKESERSYSNLILIVMQKSATIENPRAADLEKYCVTARIIGMRTINPSNRKINVEILSRAKATVFNMTNTLIFADYEVLPNIVGDYNEEMALIKMVVTKLSESGAEIIYNFDEIIKKIQSGISSEQVADVIAGKLKLIDDNKIKYIKEQRLNERLKFLLQDFEKEKLISQIEMKINSDVKKSIDENQKEYYLREKMKAIQNELGDKARKDEEVDKLRKAIKDAQMPAKIQEKALEELQRYSSTPNGVAEAGIIKSYLDLLVALPWVTETKDNDNLSEAMAELDKNHFGLKKVKDRIVEYLAVKIMTKKNPQTILCLVGPPGVGKTSLAMSVADALGRKFIKQSLGGVKDESEIRGHRRTYIGALPGRIIKGMKEVKSINPVFLLDEIDKMASDYKGDPASAMLEVLDPEQNKFFSDHYLEEPYDLSQAMFIVTANYVENIPAPLKDRMEIIELNSYTEIEKFNIGRDYLVDRQLKAHGVTKEQIIIDEDVIIHMIRYYTREAGVRELNRVLGTVIRKSIRNILVDKVETVEITLKNIEEFLGKQLYNHNISESVDQIGVVNGLAYTSFGGDTLAVEVTYYKGKGNLVLTGKLGDVMKESAQAGLSFVKANCNKFNINPDVFQENDIHIHCPEGAVPKDGPSAGITIATGIVSALTNKYVNKEVGMTGEITLRGVVLPIGGLKEKAIAAQRSGLKKILIPRENEKDIQDIPEEVKKGLDIVLVSNFDEVIGKALK